MLLRRDILKVSAPQSAINTRHYVHAEHFESVHSYIIGMSFYKVSFMLRAYEKLNISLLVEFSLNIPIKKNKNGIL